ncbi:hypothetical protein ES703_74065 [subsurface metagenome]
MCIIGMSCRRGTSTIYGVMIFVGIMFTAVIPMLLVMNQANTLQEMRKVEVGRLDEEHAMEDICFYLTPTVESEKPVLTLEISNRGELAVRITRVWINDTLRDDFDCIIPPISDSDLKIDSLTVPENQESVIYHVMAVTDRGNIFSPTCGIPNYNPESQVWTMGDYMIDVTMEKPKHSLHIIVVFDPEGENPVTVCDEDLPYWWNSYPINVPDAGTYLVKIYQFYGQFKERLLVDPVVTLSLSRSYVEVRVPA